jgi:hypothetical protein
MPNYFHRAGRVGAHELGRLLKRIFDIDIGHCPQCSASLKIIAAIEDPPVIVRILTHLRLPTRTHLASTDGESIYSKPPRAETGCQPKPTMPLGLSLSERLDREQIKRFRPCISRSTRSKTAIFH